MNLTLLDLNKDCLHLIFNELNVIELCRIKRTAKLFKEIVENILGITKLQPQIDTINSEIDQLQTAISIKKDKLYKLQLQQYLKILSSQELQRNRLITMINKFNAIYGIIEGKVDPNSVINTIRNINFFTIYAHINNCKECPFIGEKCSCPLIFMYLTFYPNNENIMFSGSYDITRKRPFDGYFEEIKLADFGNQVLIRGGWTTEHIIEHIVYRVLSAEISLRKLTNSSIVEDKCNLWYSLWDQFRKQNNNNNTDNEEYGDAWLIQTPQEIVYNSLLN